MPPRLRLNLVACADPPVLQRVHLTGGSTYINASSIEHAAGLDVPCNYIATPVGPPPPPPRTLPPASCAVCSPDVLCAGAKLFLLPAGTSDAHNGRLLAHGELSRQHAACMPMPAWQQRWRQGWWIHPVS